jgi:NADPH2:quinone reductase
MGASWLGPIKQISYVTDDIDRLVGFWEGQAQVGPWSIFRGLTLTMTYEGKPISLPVNVALCMHGGVVMELMQVLGNGPSPFHDTLNRPLIGLQRLASTSDNFTADVESAIARDMEQFASGQDATGQRYAYFRATAAPGVILELLENIPSFGKFIGGLEARIAAFAKTANALPAAAMQAPTPAPASPRTMRAAELYAYGEPEEFRMVDVPEPHPGPGEIRVRVAGVAVNPVDIKSRRGWLKDWMPLSFPARLGGDIAGTVDAIGSGVTGFKIGDRVMGMINPMSNGGYGEKVVFYAAAFTHVPEGLSLIDAAALPTGGLTGTQLVEKGIAPRPGMKGLVTGASGSTGRAAIFAALDAGAIVYAGVRASGRDAVKDLPVAGIVDITDDKALAQVGPFDFLADTVGGTVAENLFKHVNPGGTVASIAVPAPAPPADSTQRFTSLIVTFDSDRLSRFARDLGIKNRRMPVAQQLPLTDVAKAHRVMEAGGVGGKIVLVP